MNQFETTPTLKTISRGSTLYFVPLILLIPIPEYISFTFCYVPASVAITVNSHYIRFKLVFHFKNTRIYIPIHKPAWTGGLVTITLIRSFSNTNQCDAIVTLQSREIVNFLRHFNWTFLLPNWMANRHYFASTYTYFQLPCTGYTTHQRLLFDHGIMCEILVEQCQETALIDIRHEFGLFLRTRSQ